jgi:hypothetical protein
MTEVVNGNREDMVNTNMEGMEGVNSVSLDDLLADVVEVQSILQCNNIGQMIDVNEIYEKLEELTYITREQRIEYVATQLLHKLGVIDEPEVAPEERVFRFSQRDSEDSLVANSGCSGERSPASEVSGSGGTGTENYIPFSNEIITGCSEKDDMTARYINVPSAAILTLVNNENQENSQNCDMKMQQDCCQKSHADGMTLMDEAELIHSILPHHDISQIFACLEAYIDNDKRVHIVTETFLQIDSESEVGQSSGTEIPVVSGNEESTMTVPTSDNETPSSYENLECNRYCVSATVVSMQETLADADLKHGKFYSSELADKQAWRENNVHECGQAQIWHNIDSKTEHMYKLEMEVQHNDSKVCEKNTEVMPAGLEQKENVELTPLFVEKKASEEIIEGTSSSAAMNVSEGSSEVVPCSYRDVTRLIDAGSGDAHMHLTSGAGSGDALIDLTADIGNGDALIDLTTDTGSGVALIDLTTDAGSGDALTDSPISIPEEADMIYISYSDLSSIVPSLQDENGSYSVDDNLDSIMSYETSGSPLSSSVFESVQIQAIPEATALHSSPQDSGILESTIAQETNVEVTGLGKENGGIIKDCEMVLPESDADRTGRYENKLQSAMLVDVQAECDVAAVGVAEDECDASSEQSSAFVEEYYKSCDSTNSEEIFNFMDDVYEEHTHDKNVAKLHELFPDARMDYLTRISHECDSLTDMANKVLECTEQQSDDEDDTLTTAMPSVSAVVSDPSVNALVPGPSVSASAAHPPSQGCRKKEITYEEFQSALPHFDQELLTRVWEGIGNNYSRVKEFIAQHKKDTSGNDQYHTLLALFPHTDGAFLRKQCSMIGNNEAAFKDFIEEQLQNKTDSQYRTLQAIFPQLDPAFLRQKCREFGDDEAAMRAFVVEQLQHNEVDDWYHSLLAMFPDTDPAVLRESMNRIGDNAEAMRLFVTQQLDEMEGVKFQTLLAVLPDADPDYLRATFQSIGNDENSVKEFLLEALEKKDYPTRESYLKRQEMAALHRKYKEEFSIEDFIEMFPDPWKHFYEENNNNGNELMISHGIAYLEMRYRRVALDDIKSAFQKNKHNLTVTCSELDKWNGPVQEPRDTYDCTVPKTEDIPVPFLQEVIVIFVIRMWIVSILKCGTEVVFKINKMPQC